MRIDPEVPILQRFRIAIVRREFFVRNLSKMPMWGERQDDAQGTRGKEPERHARTP
jgi:hypothetical protein